MRKKNYRQETGVLRVNYVKIMAKFSHDVTSRKTILQPQVALGTFTHAPGAREVVL